MAMEVKTELKEKILVYPVEKIKERINEVAKRLFEKEIDVLKREKAEKLDLCRRKYRARYYAQQYNIFLGDEVENIFNTLNRNPIYEDDYGIMTYLLTYFWRNYPMLKFILSEYIDEFPFLNKREIKVLDVGTGVGTIPLAFSHFIEDLSDIVGVRFNVKYYLYEKSEKMRKASAILCSGLNIEPVHIESEHWVWELQDFLHRHNFDSRFDLITISYLLSELTKNECVELLRGLSPFLYEDERIIVIEPSSFATALREITADVAKVHTVGKSGEYDFYMEMKNKEEADGIILSGFDISRDFFCFSIIGRVERDRFRTIDMQKRREQESKIISGYVLSARWIKRYCLLCIVGEEYVGSIYVKEEIMPFVNKRLEGKVIKAIITENRRYRNFEAFYIELSEEGISNERVREYLRNAETDLKSGMIRGVVREINEDNVSIDSFTARWGDPLRPFLPHKRYREGNEIIAFVNYSKSQEEWFVERIEKI